MAKQTRIEKREPSIAPPMPAISGFLESPLVKK